jgi:hypothetical protein
VISARALPARVDIGLAFHTSLFLQHDDHVLVVALDEGGANVVPFVYVANAERLAWEGLQKLGRESQERTLPTETKLRATRQLVLEERNSMVASPECCKS